MIIFETTEVGRFKSSGRSAILEVISASGSLYLYRNINAQGLLSLLHMCLQVVGKPTPRDLDTIRRRLQVRTRLYLWRLLSCARMPRTASTGEWMGTCNRPSAADLKEGTLPIFFDLKEI